MNDFPTDGRNAPEPPAPLSPEQVTAYLDYALSGLITRRDELRAALAETLAAHPRIADGDDDANGMLAENRRMAETLGRTAEARRGEFKRPYIDGGKAVDGWFARFGQPLAEPLLAIRRVMDDFAAHAEAARRAAAEAEAARRRAEADKAAEEAAAALAREPQAPATNEALDRAAAAAGAADAADDHAQAPAAEHTRTYGTFGAVSSVRTTWKARISDANLLPRQYLIPDEKKIGAAIREAPKAPNGRPMVTIPGVEIYADKRTQVR